MQEYDDLAAELRQRAAQLTDDTQLWIGLAGGPGSGKSTLAEALKARLGELLTIIPLDGYHYSGLTEEQAQQRVATNDSINAELVTKVSPGNADRIIQIMKPPLVLDHDFSGVVDSVRILPKPSTCSKKAK
jgi:adenylylsulfate kinase-like enzyme